jgi:hypothetical protein
MRSPSGVDRLIANPSVFVASCVSFQLRPLCSTGITRLPCSYGVGIELERAGLQVEGYQPRPFGCEVGSQFHRDHVSRGPPISRVEVWRRVP